MLKGRKVIVVSPQILPRISLLMQMNLEKHGIELVVLPKEKQSSEELMKAVADKYRAENLPEIKIPELDEKELSRVFNNVLPADVSSQEILRQKPKQNKFFVPKNMGKVNTKKKGNNRGF